MSDGTNFEAGREKADDFTAAASRSMARGLSYATTGGDAREYTRPEDSRVETMVSASGVTPWHKLGKVVAGTLSAAEALVESGLDWRVRVEEVQVANVEWRKTGEKVPGGAVVRESDSKIMGYAGPRYTCVQNSTLFAVGESLVAAGSRWETAGSLYGGRRVWALLRLEDAKDVGGGDLVVPYLLLANAHDGSRSAECLLTSVRVCCRNTFRIATRAAAEGSFRFMHTAAVETRLVQAGDVLLAARKRWAAFSAAAEKVRAAKLGETERLEFVAAALGLPGTDPKTGDWTGQARRRLEVAKACLRMEREAAAATGDSGSVWEAFNAVTRYTTHEQNVRGKGTGAEGERRIEAATWGDGATTASEAWRSARAIAGVEEEALASV
jgi:phage/plasmid-like protein (TIGR03299 family)